MIENGVCSGIDPVFTKRIGSVIGRWISRITMSIQQGCRSGPCILSIDLLAVICGHVSSEESKGIIAVSKIFINTFLEGQGKIGNRGELWDGLS